MSNEHGLTFEFNTESERLQNHVCQICTPLHGPKMHSNENVPSDSNSIYPLDEKSDSNCIYPLDENFQQFEAKGFQNHLITEFVLPKTVVSD